MAGQACLRPTGRGFRDGTAFVVLRGRSDRGDGVGGAQFVPFLTAAGEGPLVGVAGFAAQRRPVGLSGHSGAGRGQGKALPQDGFVGRSASAALLPAGACRETGRRLTLKAGSPSCSRLADVLAL